MNHRPLRALLLTAVLVAGCAPVRAPAAPVAVAPFDGVLALASFDSAWQRVATHHYDSTFGGLDWNAVRAELRPAAAAARSDAALRRVILDMLGRLGVSHYTLIPREAGNALKPTRAARADSAGTTSPSADGPAEAGLDLRIVAGRLAAWRVHPGGAADRAGLTAGMPVRAIDGVDLAAGLARIAALPDARERQVGHASFLHSANAMLRGRLGDTLTISAGDARAPITLPLLPSDAQEIRFGNLPPQLARLTSERIPVGDACIGTIRLSVWMAPLAGAFDRALDSVRDCRGIVIDLRGNPGGVAGMVMGIGGHFVDSTRALGTLRLRTNELRFVVNPRRADSQGRPVAVYDGPLAILMDGMSASTSEVFAAGLQAIGRARVFGEVSAGQALPAFASRLPNGDVLMHAIADYLVIDGTRIEGRGVLPDEDVPLRAEDVRAGRDAPLAAAIAWITNAAH